MQTCTHFTLEGAFSSANCSLCLKTRIDSARLKRDLVHVTEMTNLDFQMYARSFSCHDAMTMTSINHSNNKAFLDARCYNSLIDSVLPLISNSLNMLKRNTITVGLLCVAVFGLVAFQIVGARLKISVIKVFKDEVYNEGKSPLPEPENLESKIARIGIGKNKIYFRHMRKAGGTQMRELLFRTLTNKKKIGLGSKSLSEKGFFYYEMEYGALDVHCAEAAPRDKVLTIAVLRDPLARLWSEFWYKLGPPSGIDRLLNASDLFIESALLHWVMREGEPPISRTAKPEDIPKPASQYHGFVNSLRGMHPFSYYSNFQLRMLTGNCPGGSHNKTQEYWCSTGSENGGGCLLGSETKRYPTSTDLQTAKDILSSFDVVLTTETLQQSTDSLKRVLAHAFQGNPDVAMNNFKPVERGKRSNANTHGYPSMTDVLDERALEYLRQDNAADIELYRHAQALAATFVSK
jgi:hypothetical protein